MDTLKVQRKNTKLIAHRGLSGIECENTCAAFVAAGNRDYFGIETDIHKTLDGRFIVLHDENTGRVAREDLHVEAIPFAEARKIRLLDKDGEPREDLCLPELQEYLRICKKYEKVGVLELKGPYSEEDCARVLEVVGTFYQQDRMVFISFDYQNMVNLRKLSPKANLQFLTGDPVNEELVEKLKAHKLDLDIYYKSLDAEKIAFLHQNGIIVNCWTVNDPAQGQALIDAGIDYITTNILQ